MQINEYDFRKIREDLNSLHKQLSEIEKGIAELRQEMLDYKKKYGDQPIQEWLESLSAYKQIDPEE